MIKKLTDEQRKLAEDNYPLVYTFARQFGLRFDDVHDYHGVLAAGLCYAARGFKEECGVKFSSYAYKCMLMTLANSFSSARSVTPVSSLDEPVEVKGRVESVQDYTPDKERFEYLLEANTAVNDVINSFNPKKQEIIRLVLEGESYQSIGDKYGYSKQGICEIFASFKKKLKKELKLD